MMRLICFFIIVLFRNCLPITGFSILEDEIVINHLESGAVESDILNFNSEYDDSDIDRLKDLSISSKFFLSFKNDQKTTISCLGLNADFSKGRYLRIVDIAVVSSWIRNFTFGHPYIKDGCLTYLVTYKNDADINQLLIDGNKIFEYQPYVFALKTGYENETQLFEAQIYSKRLVPISTWNKINQTFTYKNGNALERRSNLTGAIIRLPIPFYNYISLMTELLPIYKDKFNFTMENETWSKYSAVIQGLVEDKLDFGMITCFIQRKKWYFVSKTVLTNCEKKKFLVIKKTFTESQPCALTFQNFQVY